MTTFANIIYFYLTNIFSIFFGFLSFFLLSKYLSLENFGIYSSFINLIIFLNYLLDLGISNFCWKKIAENKKNFNKIFWFSLIIYFFTFFLTFLILSFYKIEILLFVIFSILSNLFRSFLFGLKKIKEIFISDTISYFIKILTILLFIKNLSLNIVLFSVFLHFFTSFILKLLFLKNEIVYSIKNFYFEIKKEYFSPLLSSYILLILPIFYTNFSIALFSYLFDYKISAIIYFAFNITSVASIFSSSFYSTFLPKLAEKRNKKILNFIFKISTILSILIFIILAFFYKEILILINKEYLKYIEKIFFLIFSFSLFFYSSFLSYIAFVENKYKEILIVEILANLIFFISLNFINILSYLICFIIRTIFYIFVLEDVEKKFFFFLIFLLIPFLFYSFELSMKILIFSLFLLFFIIIIKKLKILKEEKNVLKKFKFPKIFVQIFSKLI